MIPRFRFRTLVPAAFLFVVGLPAAVRAQDGPVLPDERLQPYLKRLYQQFQVAQRSNQPAEDLLNDYARQAAAAGDAQEQAILVHCRATLLGWLGRGPEARTELERSLQVYARFPASHVALGLASIKDKDLETAENRLKAALAIDPRHMLATIYLGQIYRMRAEQGEDPRGNYERAIGLFRRTIEEFEQPTGEALVGLSGCYLQLARLSSDETKAASYRDLALRMARLWRTLEPENGQAHMHVARVRVAAGDYEGAIESLESSYRANLRDEIKVVILYNLLDYYGGLSQPDKIAEVLERILQHESVQGEERAKAQRMLQDVRESGSTALLIWMVDAHLDVLRNDGLSVEKRRQAMRRLLEILKSPALMQNEKMADLQKKIFSEAFRTALKEDAAPLTIDFLRFLREANPNPRLLRILVFYLYPADDEWRTPAVRVEAVRAVMDTAALGGLVPLLYGLRDDDGAVLRATDQALVRLCEQRSPVGEEVTPLTEEEKKQARRFWYRWIHTAEGGAKVVSSIEALRDCVKLDVSFNRENRTQPIVDALAQIVLLDAEIPFDAWKAGYDFFVAYMGMDLRPVEQRDTAVTPAQREGVTRAVSEWLAGR